MKRVAFAESYGNFDWTKVLWTDEMSIRTGPLSQHWVQRPVGTEWEPKHCVAKMKHAPKVHVWGCMAAGGVGRIEVFTDNLDGPMYVQILKKHLMASRDMFWPNEQWYFQQDNDPKHTSKVATKYLTEGVFMKDYTITWPPYSPDLNPIENLWADLKKRVETWNTTTKDQLKDAVLHEWRETDPTLCEKLVASMPKRIALVLQHRGHPTGY